MYQYMSQLEQGNSRFPRKEDFLWYLIFVGTTILVGHSLSLLPAGPRTRDMHPNKTKPSKYLPEQCYASTAVTVPGIEGDRPCTSASPLIRKSWASRRCRQGGISYGWLVRLSIRMSGFLEPYISSPFPLFIPVT
jgi:hypothetical protein